MKRFYIVITLVLLLGAAAGCAAQGETGGPGSTGGPVEITVVTPFDESDGNRANFVNAYEAYEAATGNVVNDMAKSSSEEWKANIAADFQSGDEPDVLFYFTGPDADGFVADEKLVPIADIRKIYPGYASNMKDSMMPVSTFNGRQYAVPVHGYWEGLFINKNVLALCGVEIPGADYTWDMFLEDCRVIQSNGYTPIACSLMEIPNYWFEFCAFNNGDITKHLRLPASSRDEAGKVWSEGLLDIKTLYDEGFFPENTNEITDAEANMLILENKAAFMLDGSWKVGWFQTNAANIEDFIVSFVPAKGERKTTETIGGFSMGYYITKKAWDDTKKRDACVAFIEAMTTDDVVSSFASLSVTALKNAPVSAENTDSLAASALSMNKSCTGFVAAAQDLMDPAARKAFFEDIKNIVTGAVSPEDAIDARLGAENI